MTGRIPPDKVESLLSMPSDKTPEDFAMTRQWRMYFYIFGGMTVLAVMMVIANRINGERPLWQALLGFGGMIFMDIWVFGKYYRSRILAPKRFKAALAKYGMNELVSQLNDPTTHGYFILSKVYENILVITPDYLIAANEFIYNLKDVRAISISKLYVEESKIRKQKSEHVRMMLRCGYTMRIKMTDGSWRKELVALKSNDLKLFVKALNQRAVEADIRCRDLEE